MNHLSLWGKSIMSFTKFSLSIVEYVIETTFPLHKKKTKLYGPFLWIKESVSIKKQNLDVNT